MLSDRLMLLYNTLRRAFGHRNWWPADTAWEMMVGAVLTQNTNWKNVERAIANLKRAGSLEPLALMALAETRLHELVRPAGYFRQKSARLRRLAEWWVERMDADEENLKRMGVEQLREELLAIKGVGLETADSIILYAAGKPTFIVDAYTARVCARHAIIPMDAGYAEVKEVFEGNLPRDVELYRDFHAQLVEVGKRYCRKRPLCAECPALPALGPPTVEV